MATFTGTTGDDLLTGTTGDDVISARTNPTSGSDALFGLGGDDVIIAGVEVNDANVRTQIDGGDGQDDIRLFIDNPAAVGAIDIEGGAGDDAITVTGSPSSGGLSIDGGAGFDTLTVTGGLPAAVTLSGIEKLIVPGAQSQGYPYGARISLTTDQVAGVGGAIATTDGSNLTVFLSGTGAVDFSHAFQGLSVQASDGVTAITGTAFDDALNTGEFVSPTAGVAVYGGEGNDNLAAIGASAEGGSGDDVVTFTDATAKTPGVVVDGGSGQDSVSLTFAVSGTAVSADSLDVSGGLTLPSGAVVSGFESLSRVTLVGDNNTLTGGDRPVGLSVTGDDNVIHGSSTSTSAVADGAGNQVYIVPAGPGETLGARDTTGTSVIHLDYSSASTTVTFDSEVHIVSHQGAFDYIFAYEGPSYAAATSSVELAQQLGVTIVVQGGTFNDSLYGDANSYVPNRTDLHGGGGDDLIVAGLAGAELDGGAGMDTVSFNTTLFVSTSGGFSNDPIGSGGPSYPQSAGVIVDLTLQGQTQNVGYGVFTLTNFENLTGSNGPDVLVGDEAANVLSGLEGNDVIRGGDGNDVLIGGPGDDLLDGGAGDDVAVFSVAFSTESVTYAGSTLTISGPDGTDTLRNIEHLRFTDGIYDVGADGRLVTTLPVVLNGTSGADTLTGGATNEVLNGLEGNDTLNAGGGSDIVNGGPGVDTATYAGFAHDYALSLHAASGAVAGGPEGGQDVLSSVENVQFLDGTLTFDSGSTAAQIVRLYDSFLGRTPDVAGFNGYLNYVAAGHSLQDMAANAAASPEFADATAGLTDAQYITYVYEHSLHREPDAYGLQQYEQALSNGTLTRTSMIVQAAEGPEHVALTAPTVAQGLWVPDEKVESLELLYDAAVQRQPDAYGIAGYSAELAQGTTYRQIANQMAGSAEFQAAHAGQDDRAYIDSLYVAEVGRHADPTGMAAYLDQLAQGYTRGDILWETAFSQEHQSHVLAVFDPLLG